MLGISSEAARSAERECRPGATTHCRLSTCGTYRQAMLHTCEQTNTSVAAERFSAGDKTCLGVAPSPRGFLYFWSVRATTSIFNVVATLEPSSGSDDRESDARHPLLA